MYYTKLYYYYICPLYIKQLLLDYSLMLLFMTRASRGPARQR